jgi:hypothetical protein
MTEGLVERLKRLSFEAAHGEPEEAKYADPLEEAADALSVLVGALEEVIAWALEERAPLRSQEIEALRKALRQAQGAKE